MNSKDNKDKICIGLRGWKFDIQEVLDKNGELKALEEMSEEDKVRIIRLSEIIGNACHVCMLKNPEEGWDVWEKATVVYGEPTSEVLLCDKHESIFEHWFFNEGGKAYKGKEELQEKFHNWIKNSGFSPP